MFVGRGDLTNDEWARLKPHLPKSGQRGGRWNSRRRVINGILCRQRTRVPWRDLPTRFGKWKTVYERHRHVVAAVRAGGGQWSVVEVEVRRAAAELNAVGMDRQDLVRIGPFHRVVTRISH